MFARRDSEYKLIIEWLIIYLAAINFVARIDIYYISIATLF